MRKITFLQLTAAVIMLAFGLTLAGPLVQTAEADHNPLLCFLAELAVAVAWNDVNQHCNVKPDFNKCNKAWETFGIVVAFRDEVCAHDDDDADDDEQEQEESSS